jgi:ankyrin repeat protein
MFAQIVRDILLTFEKKNKQKTFYDLHNEYWKKLEKVTTHEEKKKLSDKLFSDFKALIESKIEFDVNELDQNGYYLLDYVICMYDSFDYVKELIETGANPSNTNKHGTHPTTYIARMGNVQLLEYWLERKFNVETNDINNNIFAQCVMSKGTTLKEKQDFLKVLITNNFQINCEEITRHYKCPAIFFFSRNVGTPDELTKNYQLVLEILQMLIKADVNVNECDNTGKSGLVISSKNSNAQKVQLYIDLGADLNIKDDNQKTAMDYASTVEVHKVLYNENLKNLTKRIEQLESKFVGTIIEC